MTREDGIRMREARRARVRMIRARVVGGSVALFLLVWSLIAVVLVTGHDPALARKALTAGAGTTSTATSTAPTVSTGSTSAGSSGATSSSTGQSPHVGPVTSSQS
jgi:type IV secretory pathway TrbL component